MHGDQRQHLVEALQNEFEVLMPENGHKFTI
jgi:hypothetical protein